MKELREILGVPKSTIYFWIKQKNFPRPIKLGPRTVGWVNEEIFKWIEKKKKESQDK